jgi:hypothetical protein
MRRERRGGVGRTLISAAVLCGCGILATQASADIESAPHSLSQRSWPPAVLAQATEPAPAPGGENGAAAGAESTTTEGARIERATYEDADSSYGVNAGDRIVIELGATSALASLRLEDIRLALQGDSFGRSPKLEPSGPHAATITLGAQPRLKIGGRFAAGRSTEGAASGVSLRDSTPVDIQDARVLDLQKKFDAELENARPQIERWANSGNAFYYYYLSNQLEGLISMAEASHDERYLKLAMGYIDRMLDSGRDADGDGYLDFKTTGDNLDKYNVALYDWRSFRPVARIARVIQSDNVWRGKYEDKMKRYRTFIDHDVIEKWSKTRSKAKGLDWFEDDGLIHRLAHFGDILVDSYLATGSADQRRMLVEVATKVKKQIKVSQRDAKAVEWNKLFKNSGPIIRDYAGMKGVSDTSHASGTVAFVAADALGPKAVFAEADLQRLSYTLLHVLWNGSMDNPQFADFVDGGMHPKRANEYGDRNLADGWMKLGQFDSTVQKVMMVAMDASGGDRYRLQAIGNLARNYAKAGWE